MQGRRSRAIALFPPPSLLPRRTLILRQPNSTVLAFWALPALTHPPSLPPPRSLLPRRTLILRQPNSTVLAFWALPALVFKTIIIDIFFILYKVSVDTVSTWVGCNWGTAWLAHTLGIGVAACCSFQWSKRRRGRARGHLVYIFKTPSLSHPLTPSVPSRGPALRWAGASVSVHGWQSPSQEAVPSSPLRSSCPS